MSHRIVIPSPLSFSSPQIPAGGAMSRERQQAASGGREHQVPRGAHPSPSPQDVLLNSLIDGGSSSGGGYSPLDRLNKMGLTGTHYASKQQQQQQLTLAAAECGEIPVIEGRPNARTMTFNPPHSFMSPDSGGVSVSAHVYNQQFVIPAPSVNPLSILSHVSGDDYQQQRMLVDSMSGGARDMYEDNDDLDVVEDLVCETVAFDESMTFSSSNGNIASQYDSTHELSSSNQNAASDIFDSAAVSVTQSSDEDDEEEAVLSDLSVEDDDD